MPIGSVPALTPCGYPHKGTQTASSPHLFSAICGFLGLALGRACTLRARTQGRVCVHQWGGVTPGSGLGGRALDDYVVTTDALRARRAAGVEGVDTLARAGIRRPLSMSPPAGCSSSAGNWEWALHWWATKDRRDRAERQACERCSAWPSKKKTCRDRARRGACAAIFDGDRRESDA
jgi:hypothetical protein